MLIEIVPFLFNTHTEMLLKLYVYCVTVSLDKDFFLMKGPTVRCTLGHKYHRHVFFHIASLCAKIYRKH